MSSCTACGLLLAACAAAEIEVAYI